MIRACVLPNIEYEQITDLSSICEKFYVLYEQLFGNKNCSYSVHIVSSHLQKIRGHNPLTETSAFKYENFYSEIRRSYVPGTKANLKQIFQRTILKRKLLNAIQDLPKGKQDIIRLFYVEEYSLKEISSFLQIPIGTVKSRLFKAREKLKSIMKSYSYEK